MKEFLRLWDIVGDPKANPPIAGILPIAKSSWWAGVKDGKYPKPIKIGPRTTAWRRADVEKLVSDISSGKELQPSWTAKVRNNFKNKDVSRDFSEGEGTPNKYEDGRKFWEGTRTITTEKPLPPSNEEPQWISCAKGLHKAGKPTVFLGAFVCNHCKAVFVP